MVRVAERAPEADGVNVKIEVQELLAEIVPPFTQVPPVFAKSPEFVLVIVK
jgi:hypothetical protein